MRATVRYRDSFDEASLDATAMPLLGAQRRFARGSEWSGRREVAGFSLRPLGAPWSAAVVEQAVRQAMAEFPVLEALVSWDAGVPILVPTASPQIALDVRYTLDLDDPAVEAVAREVAELGTAPVHVTIANTAKDAQRLYVFIEHLRVDQHSLPRVVAAIVRALSGAPGRAPRPWKDEVGIARRLLDVEAGASPDAAYWGDRLRGARLPTPVRAKRGANRLVVPQATTVKLAREAGYFGAALHALHDTLLDDGPHLVGYAWGARPPFAADTVTCVINTLPSPYGDHRSPTDFRRSLWSDFEHGSVSYDDIVEDVNLDRRAGWSGEVHAWFAVEGRFEQRANAVVEPLHLVPLKADIVVSARTTGDGLVSLRVATDDDRTSRDLLDAWVRALKIGGHVLAAGERH
ncbi:Uncharacterised protein [Mycobacteroides abscessus subsp. abscessus]|nr:Uncharacterised protein [Mycobacteroides abscessus subsp. abscessus]